MNKLLLVVLLAVCLVSVHAFVKRDAPTPTTEKNVLEDFQKTVNDITQKINEVASKAFNPEEMKKTVNAAAETLSKTLDDIKSKMAPSKATE